MPGCDFTSVDELRIDLRRHLRIDETPSALVASSATGAKSFTGSNGAGFERRLGGERGRGEEQRIAVRRRLRRRTRRRCCRWRRACCRSTTADLPALAELRAEHAREDVGAGARACRARRCGPGGSGKLLARARADARARNSSERSQERSHARSLWKHEPRPRAGRSTSRRHYRFEVNRAALVDPAIFAARARAHLRALLALRRPRVGGARARRLPHAHRLRPAADLLPR